MSKESTHKTANGQEINMETLILKNEKVRAVGNMNVNARGDVIDNTNKTTSSRSAQVNKNYRKQIGNVAKDLPVVTSKKAAESQIAKQYAAPIADTIVGLDDEPVGEAPPVGLASAIAKAKEAKQESQSTPAKKETSGKNKSGDKK